jgi:hypothetical protein
MNGFIFDLDGLRVNGESPFTCGKESIIPRMIVSLSKYSVSQEQLNPVQVKALQALNIEEGHWDRGFWHLTMPAHSCKDG